MTSKFLPTVLCNFVFLSLLVNCVIAQRNDFPATYLLQEVLITEPSRSEIEGGQLIGVGQFGLEANSNDPTSFDLSTAPDFRGNAKEKEVEDEVVSTEIEAPLPWYSTPSFLRVFNILVPLAFCAFFVFAFQIHKKWQARKEKRDYFK